MLRTRGWFQTEDGLDLFYQSWKPHRKPAAVIAMVHGYSEHSGRYRNPARFLVPEGVALYGCDLRGHGRSPGQRGHIQRFSDYLLDVDAFLKRVRLEQPDCPPFLLGHSMGGLIAASYAEEHSHELPGLILSSPFLRLKMPVPAWKRLLAITLSSILPALPLKSGIQADLISHDPAVVLQSFQDPLNHPLTTPRWFTEILAAQKRTFEGAASIRTPVLLVYAGSDGIADPECAARFFERLVVPDKTLRRYDGYYHEIFNEIGKEIVFQDMNKWLSNHAACPAPPRLELLAG